MTNQDADRSMKEMMRKIAETYKDEANRTFLFDWATLGPLLRACQADDVDALIEVLNAAAERVTAAPTRQICGIKAEECQFVKGLCVVHNFEGDFEDERRPVTLDMTYTPEPVKTEAEMLADLAAAPATDEHKWRRRSVLIDGEMKDVDICLSGTCREHNDLPATPVLNLTDRCGECNEMRQYYGHLETQWGKEGGFNRNGPIVGHPFFDPAAPATEPAKTGGKS